MSVNDDGFESLRNLSGNAEFGFENMHIDYDMAFKRVEEICEFYKDF